jgi:hypothetical protein
LRFRQSHLKDDDKVVDEKKDADESAVVEEVLANRDEVVGEENDAIVSTVVGEVLADLVTATSISISVFSYFGSRRSLVEDKDDGPNRDPITTFIVPSPSYDADDEDEYKEEDDDDDDDEENDDDDDDDDEEEDEEDDKEDDKEEDEEDDIPETLDHFFKQEFLHVHCNFRQRLVGPYRARGAFAEDGHLVIYCEGGKQTS